MKSVVVVSLVMVVTVKPCAQTGRLISGVAHSESELCTLSDDDDAKACGSREGHHLTHNVQYSSLIVHQSSMCFDGGLMHNK